MATQQDLSGSVSVSNRAERRIRQLNVATSVVLILASIVLVWRVLETTTSRSDKLNPQSLTGAPAMGDPQAKVAMIVYSDFQCPFCGQFARETLPELNDDYVRQGKLLLSFRHLPLESIHPLAVSAALAAQCGYDQGRFWQVHDELFDLRGRLDMPHLLEAATRAGVDQKTWLACMEHKDTVRIDEDVQRARELVITATPYFLIGEVRGGRAYINRVINGAQPLSVFRRAIDRAVSQVSK